MGWGKALSAVVVMSISVMLVVSVLPVGASHYGDLGKGKCNGAWSLISTEVVLIEHDYDASEKDKNGNHHVCWKMTGNGVYQYKDDRPIK
ncbi:MAG: hypothetical protein IIA83_11070 [Thaumarchaeota archaeon]|nr:hypothetical protein [Nitrososphaerota archaeon]